MKSLVAERVSPMTYTPDYIDRLSQAADFQRIGKAVSTAGAVTMPLQTADREEAS